MAKRHAITNSPCKPWQNMMREVDGTQPPLTGLHFGYSNPPRFSQAEEAVRREELMRRWRLLKSNSWERQTPPHNLDTYARYWHEGGLIERMWHVLLDNSTVAYLTRGERRMALRAAPFLGPRAGLPAAANRPAALHAQHVQQAIALHPRQRLAVGVDALTALFKVAEFLFVFGKKKKKKKKTLR
eukprot:NODE_3792_length_633_cov_121.890411_g2729_i0.p1 GENE.NODE_3792_length_633_cov_121.890411_g2729_i0~~NODE_3792_length_633_cov_121.890411_g2729_i0.p1  ORF type:complete len:209 (-),score=73.19 NODE_3792_length_633_cov_121.890411_g2729_i0:5-559(-)